MEREQLREDSKYSKPPNLSRGLNKAYFGEIGEMRPQYPGCGLNLGFCSNIMTQSSISI